MNGGAVASGEFLKLPVLHGDMLRMLGPRPEQAAVAVDPLLRIEDPLTVVQSFVGGVCTSGGELVQPVEVLLVCDPSTVVPHKQIPTGAVLDAFANLPEIIAALPAIPGFEMLRDAIAEPATLPPVFYCRKRHTLFVARSPNTFEPLSRVPGSDERDAAALSGQDMPVALLTWDGPAEEGRTVARYGGRGGSSDVGEYESLERMALAQGEVTRRWASLVEQDAASAARLADAHACCGCDDRERCYPQDGGYAFVADRLVPINATESPLVVLPLGEWRLWEVARAIGGVRPSELLSGRGDPSNELTQWCDRRVAAMESYGPGLLLEGETDGRGLLEIARLKLGLIAQVLEQLATVWRVTGRPHLCWNDETVRVAWHGPASTPAAYWGFQPIVRKLGVQPATNAESVDGAALVYPPAFSDADLLAPGAAEASRQFGEERMCGLFVKRAAADGERVAVDVLIEDLGVGWELFSIGDAFHVEGESWRAIITPAAQRDPDDGEGLPFSGFVTGEQGALEAGASFSGLQCRWYPRFGEAVDLHALGLMLLESLLSHDERGRSAFKDEIAAEIEVLRHSLGPLPIEQYESFVRTWVEERAEADSPAALWSRRNLLYRRPDRNDTRLDAFPPALWHAILTFALRLVTTVAGFSFCESRASAAPRVDPKGVPLPLLELRGLIALLDDQLLRRSAPGTVLCKAVEAS